MHYILYISVSIQHENNVRNFYLLFTQSYAGKYVPAIGYKIHTENMNNPAVKINLKGLAIGDGLCDPENVNDDVLICHLHVYICPSLSGT